MDGSPVTAKNFFSHEDAHPCVLDLVLLDHYGVEWWEWLPQVVVHTLEADLAKAGVARSIQQKLSAIQVLHRQTTFWTEWEVFNAMVAALNGITPDFVHWQPPTLQQLVVGVWVARKIRDGVAYSAEVRAYITQICKQEQVLVPQAPLEWVRHEDLEHYDIDKGVLTEIQTAWPAAQASGELPANASPLALMQLGKLLLAEDALQASQAQMKAQLPIVEAMAKRP